MCIRGTFTLHFRFAHHFSIVCEEEKILSVYTVIYLHLINSLKSYYTNDNFSRLMKIKNKSMPAKISLSFCYCNKKTIIVSIAYICSYSSCRVADYHNLTSKTQ